MLERPRRNGLLILAGLLAITLIVHGPALFDGPFFDDHWQASVFRTAGWTWHDLAAATTFETPGPLNSLWWQDQPLQIRYPRPVAMLVLKVEYLLTGGNAAALHAFSLLWHLLTGLLVYRLAGTVFADRRWAFAAAALFLASPHSVISVGWIAAQNAILSTFFLVAAMLAYLAAPGTVGCHGPVDAAISPRTRPVQASLPGATGSLSASAAVVPGLSLLSPPRLCGETAVAVAQRPGPSTQDLALSSPFHIVTLPDCHIVSAVAQHSGLSTQHCPSLRRGPFLACLLLWLAAILCRESAIVLPLLAVAAEAGTGGWGRLRRRVRPLAILCLLAAAYAAWRLIVFPRVPLPEPYFHSPAGLAYLPWAAGKMLRLLIALVFYTPMLTDPSSAGGSLPRAALTCGIMSALLLAVVVWYLRASRRVPNRCLWPAWTVAAFLPVLPVIMLPHFAYASAAGWSIVLAILLASLTGRKRTILTVFVFAATLWSLALQRVVWRGIVRSEQVLYADLLAGPPPSVPNSRIFFINLPMLGVYAPVVARAGWDRPDLDGCVLTFAPSVLRAQQPCVVDATGPNELLVTMSAPGYFAGPSSRMLLGLTRAGRPLEPGRTVHTEEFDATLLPARESDAALPLSPSAGPTKVRFVFRRPLASPEYRFYLSSPDRPAQPLCFDAPVAPDDLARQARAWRQANAAPLAEVDRYLALMDFLRRTIRSDVLLTAGQQ